MNFSRKNIEFKTQDQVSLRGWFYEPKKNKAPFPTIVMAHGFSATKEMTLDKYAEVFAEAGFAVLVYDNRNLGESGGEPRQHIDPLEQIADYRDAISFVRTLPEVDKERIGIWGTSYSGGHVLQVAALDKRVKCVVSQVPLIYGLEVVRRVVRADFRPLQIQALIAERENLYAGKPHTKIPICGNPNAAFSDIKTVSDFFFGIWPQAPTWKNEVTLISIEKFIEYYPAAYIKDISTTPLLVIIQKEDELVAADVTLKAFEEALQPKEVRILPGLHFDIYSKNFKPSSEAARDWFVKHL